MRNITNAWFWYLRNTNLFSKCSTNVLLFLVKLMAGKAAGMKPWAAHCYLSPCILFTLLRWTAWYYCHTCLLNIDTYSPIKIKSMGTPENWLTYYLCLFSECALCSSKSVPQSAPSSIQHFPGKLIFLPLVCPLGSKWEAQISGRSSDYCWQ